MSCYIFLSTGTFAAIISAGIASLILVRRKPVALQFMYFPDEEMIEEMDQDLDGVVDSKEYLEYMLIKTGLCSAQAIEMVNDCFKAYDGDNKGAITKANLVRKGEVLEMLKRKYGIVENVEYSIAGTSTDSLPLLGGEEK